MAKKRRAPRRRTSSPEEPPRLRKTSTPDAPKPPEDTGAGDAPRPAGDAPRPAGDVPGPPTPEELRALAELDAQPVDQKLPDPVITVSDDAINSGRPTNIPVVVEGQQGVEELRAGAKPSVHQVRHAVDHAAGQIDSGEQFPSFDTFKEARQARQVEQAQHVEQVEQAQQVEQARQVEQAQQVRQASRTGGPRFEFVDDPVAQSDPDTRRRADSVSDVTQDVRRGSVLDTGPSKGGGSEESLVVRELQTIAEKLDELPDKIAEALASGLTL